MKQVTVQELKALRDQQADVLVIDVREAREFRQGHIPDAQLMPLAKIFKDSTLVAQDQAIVFVCGSGRRSLRVAQFLSHKGYQNITILTGGMSEWRAQQLLIAVEYEERSKNHVITP